MGKKLIDQMIRLIIWWIRGFAMMGIAYITVLLIIGPLYVGFKFGVWQIHLPLEILIATLRFFILLAVLYGTGNWLMRLFFNVNRIAVENKKKRPRFGFLRLDQGYEVAKLNDAVEVEVDKKKLVALLAKNRENWTAEDLKSYEAVAYLDRSE